MLLYRYIVKELIFPFLASLAIIIFLFTMQQVILMLDRIVSKNIDPLIVLEVFLVQLGWILALGIPMAILTATLMTFGRMAGDNEITAIKASGRSMSALVMPVMAAAAVVSVALCCFHDLVLPEANHNSANLLSAISRKRPAAFIESGILIRDFQNYALYVEDVNSLNGNISGIRVFSDGAGSDPTVTVADSGNIRMTGDGEYLVLTLNDGETHSSSRSNEKNYLTVKFKEQIVYIKNVDTRFDRTGSDSRGDREMNISALMQNVRSLQNANAALETERQLMLDSISIGAPNAGGNQNVLVGDSLPLTDTISAKALAATTQNKRAKISADGRHKIQNRLKFYESNIERIDNNKRANNLLIAQYMVETHKKFAIPAACLMFVLIGAPLGIMARRGGLAVGASYSIFFFIIYWVFLITGENWADRGFISPAVGMWAGNMFLAICGTALMILMLRETTISFGFLKTMFGKSVPFFKYIENMKIFRLPEFVFGGARLLLNKINGMLPAYLMAIFLGYVIGLLIALGLIFVTIDYVSNLKRFETATHFQIALFYYYYMPWIAQTVFPIVLFLASMFSMGKLAKTSELTAMKAAGINIRQLTMPLLALGLLLSAGVFYCGEKIIPYANEQRLILRGNFGKKADSTDSVAKTIREYRRNFFYFAAPDIMYIFNEYCTEPQFFRGVKRYTFAKNGIVELIDAAEAEFDNGQWRFLNGKTRAFSKDGITLENFAELPDNVLKSAPLDLVKRVRTKEEMSYWELSSYIEAAKRRGEKVHKFVAELQFKIALPFMNFIVILFGLSLAAKTGRRGGVALFGVGLLLSFIFWIFSRFMLVFAQNGYIPTLFAAWIGNMIFFILGLIFYRKAAD